MLNNKKIDIVKLNPYQDNRGRVFEPIDNINSININNFHVVITKPGTVRGNHYHKNGTETLICLGEASIVYKYQDELPMTFTVDADEIYKFTFPANVSHAIKNIGRENLILLCFNTCPNEPENTIKDIIIT